VQQKSRRQFLFSMNCGAAAARALRKLPLVEGVGIGCQPVPRAHPSPRDLRESRVPAGSRDLLGPGPTGPGTYSEVQQKSRRQFLFSMNCGAAAARALRKLPLVEGVGTGCQPVLVISFTSGFA